MRGSRVGGFLLAVALALTALAVFGKEERLTATGVPASPSTGCASGRQPNLVGTVTDPFGNPFPTEVSIRLSAETTGNPYGWGPVNPGLSASTDVFGRYAMCIDVNSLRHDDKLGTLHGLQVIAKTTSEMWQELGDSPSAFVSIDTCAQRCTLDVTMTSPVVKGTIAEGDSLRVAANGIYLADVDISMDGTFSLVLNPPGRFPEGFGVGVGITLTATPNDSSKVPIEIVRTYSGATIVVDQGLAFETANISLRLLGPGGEAVDDGREAYVVLTRMGGGGCNGTNRYDWWFDSSDPCKYRPLRTNDGELKGKIPDGDWTVVWWVEGFAADWAEFTLSSGGSVIEAQRGSLAASGGNLDLHLGAGRVRFLPISSFGAVEESIVASTHLIRGSYSEGVDLGATGLGNGIVGWNPIENGVYRLVLRNGAIDTPLTVRVVGAPEDPVIDASCSYVVDSDDGSITTTCDQPPPVTDSNGSYAVELVPPNFLFQVCLNGTVGGECQAPSGPEVWYRIERAAMTRDSDGLIEFRPYESIDFSSSDVKLALPSDTEPKHYRIVVRPPSLDQGQGLLSDLVLYLRRNVDGSIDRCGVPSITELCPVPTPLDNPSGPWELSEPLEFRAAPLVVTVVRPSPCATGCGVENSSVSIARTRGFGLSEFESLPSWNSDSNGRIGVDLAPGHYRLSASPGEAESLGFVGGDIEITVGESGLVTAINGVAIDPSSSLSLPLRNPNITGVVLADGEPEKWVDLEFEKWDPVLGSFEWTGISRTTNDLGRFNLIVDDGRWRVTARPNDWVPIGDVVYTSGRQHFEVAGGALSRVGPCITNQNLPCDSVANDVVITLGTPNVSGVIKRIDPSTGQHVSVRSVALSVQRRNSTTGIYEESGFSRVDYLTGRFGLVLQTGMHRLTISASEIGSVNPPLTRKYLLVTTQGSCLVPTDSVTSCGSLSQTFTLLFDPPNFQGRVTGNGQGWPSWLTLYRYVPASVFGFDYINPVSTWALNLEGRFGLILEDGYYRLEADPVGFRPHNFGMAKLLVGINGSTWCLTTAVDGVPTPCQTWQNGDIHIDLPGGNFEAQIKYFNGTSLVALPGGSVEVRRYENQGGWSFDQRINLSSTGRFSLRLDNDSYGSSAVVRYDLIIDPTWVVPSAGLVRRVVTVWLGDFDDDGTRDDVCSSLPVNGECSDLVTVLQEITVSTGNFTARVIDASTGDEVDSGSVSLRGWGPQCWHSGVDCHLSTFLRPGGLISNDLVPGPWRIDVTPFANSVNLVGRSVEIQVVSASKWCLQHDFETLGSGCTQPSDFEIELLGYNISAIIEKDGQPVPNAWVQIETKESSGSSTWWSTGDEGAPGGSLTRADGSFINHRPDGLYRIVVNPPYDNPLGINRFTREFSVINGVDDLPAVVEVPDSNLSFRLVDRNGAPVSRAFVYLQKRNAEGWWQWTDMWSNSTATGQVGLLVIGAGQYRLVVDPSVQTGGLARFTRTFEVNLDGQGTLTFVGAPVPVEIVVPRSNLTGSVTTDGTMTNDDGWVEVRQGGVYVSSTSVDQEGNYGLFLEDGTFQVRFHPNYRGGASQPIEVEVVVSNGIVESWRYLSQAPGTDNCSSTPCDVDVNLSFDPPNVRIDVTVSQVAREGVFVVLTGPMNGVASSRQFVTDENGSVAAAVPLATYQLSVVYVAPDGTTLTSSQSITVDQTTAVSSPFVVGL